MMCISNSCASGSRDRCDTTAGMARKAESEQEMKNSASGREKRKE